MEFDHDTGRLKEIPVDKIEPNPDNPRVAFRQGELEELQESIRQYGIQVPIAVFKKGRGFILIDGERRWRCSSKLNLKTIPALIQDEPGPLENLLLMFNIHALREQWDLLTIALKLPRIISLLEKKNKKRPTENEISVKTGLARGVIRRCRLLTELPKKYTDMLLEEIKKPKSKQELSEDFFIEMEKSLKTVMRAMPDVIADKDAARDILIKKYKSKVIENLVDFRKVAKIARAKNVGADPEIAQGAIKRLLTSPKYSITSAWNDTVAEAYVERDIVTRIDYLLVKLDEVQESDVDEDVREKLEELVDKAKSILEAEE